MLIVHVRHADSPRPGAGIESGGFRDEAIGAMRGGLPDKNSADFNEHGDSFVKNRLVSASRISCR